MTDVTTRQLGLDDPVVSSALGLGCGRFSRCAGGQVSDGVTGSPSRKSCFRRHALPGRCMEAGNEADRTLAHSRTLMPRQGLSIARDAERPVPRRSKACSKNTRHAPVSGGVEGLLPAILNSDPGGKRHHASSSDPLIVLQTTLAVGRVLASALLDTACDVDNRLRHQPRRHRRQPPRLASLRATRKTD